MGGADRNDALIGNYSSVRKTLKWTVKVVFHFIEEAFLNAYILNEKFGVKKAFFGFWIRNYHNIITKNQLPELQIYEHPKLGRHYVELIPPTEKKATSQKRCAVFSKSNKRKKVDTNANIAVHTQVCIQRYVSKFSHLGSFKV